MKALIVDDNIAIQEILSEILSSEGWTTEQTGDIDDAIAKLDSYNPDLLVLDSRVNGLRTFRMLDEIDEGSEIRVIILCKNGEMIPKDNPNVIGIITKPFRSSDILSCVREAGLKGTDKSVSKGFMRKFFPKSNSDSQENTSVQKQDVRFGHSYYVVEDEPELVYEAGRSLSGTCQLLVVTSGRTKAVNDRFKDLNVKVIGLSTKAKVGYLEMSKLGTLMNTVMKFIDENDRPVVMIDGMAQLINVNGVNAVMTMVHQLISSKVTVIVSVEEDFMSEKDTEVMRSMMEEYTKCGETNGEN